MVFSVKHLCASHKGISLQIFISFAVSLCIMSDGMSLGWSATKIAQMTDEKLNETSRMTLSEASSLGTLPVYSALISLPLTLFSADWIGRKWTIFWGGGLTFISWIFMYATDQIEYIYAAVIIRGLGGFNIYAISQIYIAEIAESKIRGILGSFVPILMNLGIFVSYICIMLISLTNLAIFSLIICGIMFPILCFAPRTPYFLYMKNKPLQAEKALKRLRGAKYNIQNELDEIKTVIEKDNLDKGSYRELFTNKKNFKILCIVVMTQIFQQLAGIDAILLFLEVILKSSQSNISSKLASIIFGGCKFGSCAVALILIDKLGRKPLMKVSCFLTALTLTALSVYYYVKDVLLYDVSEISWLPVVLLLIYIFGYNIGLGVVPFILGSEMFPTKYKAAGVIATQIAYAVSMLSVTETMAWLNDAFGFYLVFFILAINTYIAFVFSVFCLIETKGKTFKEILNELK